MESKFHGSSLYNSLQTEKEIADLRGEIQNLEDALAAKVPPMMVVHTRLENRTYRPNVELCRDQPQYDMVDEVAKITASMQTLQDQLEVARYGAPARYKFCTSLSIVSL